MIEMLALRFNEGGWAMWVILSVFAVAVAVTLERLIFYFIICNTNGVKMVANIAKALNSNKVAEAKEIAGRRKAPVNVLIQTAIELYDSGLIYDDIQEGVEQAAIKELPKMSKRLNYLSLFANIATLLGLLGTITGLQLSFASLATAEAAQKATLLARGISQAMNTTAFGLLVAVPCMVAFTILSNKQQSLTNDLDEAVVRLTSYMKKKLAK